MKSNCLLFIYCLVLLIGCTTNEEVEFDHYRESGNFLLAEILSIDEDESGQTNIHDDFYNFRRDLNAYFEERASDPGLGTGNVMVRSPLGATYVFNTDEGGYLFITSKAEDSKIQLMSDNRARFSINTNNPLTYVTDSGFNRILSNECHDNRLGNFNTNVIAGYRTRTYEFGTVYFPSGPYGSADVLHLSTKVDNGLVEFDQNNELINCGIPSETKSVSVKLIKHSHNNRLQPPKISVVIK